MLFCILPLDLIHFSRAATRSFFIIGFYFFTQGGLSLLKLSHLLWLKTAIVLYFDAISRSSFSISDQEGIED